MLMPKKVKYRKQMRGRRNGKAWRGGDLAFGEYGSKAMESAWITDRQIEASRVAITRFIKRGGKAVDPDFPGQAVYQEAGGNPHGQRQRRSGKVGCGGQAGPHHVRDGGRRRSHRARSPGLGGAQAADSDEIRHPRGRILIMPRRIEKIREAGVNELEAQHKELTEQIFRLRFQLSTGQAEALKRLREAKKIWRA